MCVNELVTYVCKHNKYILLEAPTGFGKSPVAISVALTLGTSYICTSTKDLQTQYARDFPFLKVAKGKNNFICAVKEDFIRNGTHKCGTCLSNECYHTSADYGPCMSNKDFRKSRCKYRTFPIDYKIKKGTIEEKVFIDCHSEEVYRNKYSQWSYAANLKEELRLWRPCEYYHQFNIALASSHSVLNYSIFLALLTNKFIGLPSRELLVLDEAHRLEEEVVTFTGISISRRKWRKYIPDLRIDDHGYNVKEWLGFLDDLREMMLDVRIPRGNEELLIELEQDVEKLESVIEAISLNPDNWIVSEIQKEGPEGVTKVELKPLDVSPYCTDVFGKCKQTLMMSATILDAKALCSSVGLKYENVKVIRVGSDFPVKNRPIHALDVAYLNYNNLQKTEVKTTIASAIDKIMTSHKEWKGIIHTTSYEQLNFIKQNISKLNQRRLLETNPDVERDEIINEHFNSSKPTVLISPSLHLGLDLKDDLSRFQIITKVPYPSLGDRWIDEKRKRSEQWYSWQTALRLVQGYGRSIRSKDDWATTYVLDSAFGPFVRRNKNILPHWFIEAIQPHLNGPAGQSGFDTVQVFTTSKEDDNEMTNNHHSTTNISEKNEISFYIPKPSDQSGTLASLDSYNKNENNRLEPSFICPYCSKFSSTLEKEYQRHIVLKHPGKSGYPNMAVA
jgi:ATP-dependent DNA helicase DinG